MPQYEDVYEPPIMDATFTEKMDDLIDSLTPNVPSYISDAFSVERNYSKGDICIYDNKVYEFTSAKSAGAWDSTKVTQTTIGAVCTSLSNSLTQKQDKIKSTSFSGTTDASGNIALQNVTVAGNIILSVVSTNGYCTMPTPSGNTWYVKVLSNTNPVQPVASTNTTIYLSYV